MAWSSYAFADAWDAAAADFDNFETVFTIPYLFAPKRVPRGGTVTRALSGHEMTDGWRDFTLEQQGDPHGMTLFDDLDAYVTTVHGSWAGEDAEIALKVRGLDGDFAYWNCIAHFPRIGEDYTHNPMDSRYVDDLKLRYTVINEYTPA